MPKGGCLRLTVSSGGREATQDVRSNVRNEDRGGGFGEA
ncbi:MAG: hypothetical protein AAFX58_15865, partial [Pseudomonadota bacterium]